jgi:hypothetical protein
LLKQTKNRLDLNYLNIYFNSKDIILKLNYLKCFIDEISFIFVQKLLVKRSEPKKTKIFKPLKSRLTKNMNFYYELILNQICDEMEEL